MNLQRDTFHFYSNLKISRSRFIIGVILGLFFAFSFYGFLYLVREAIRILFFYGDNYLLVFTDDQVNVYNLFFAYIATIMGQSLCLVYWLDVPVTKYGKYRFRVRAVINDQRNLNSYFLSWFSRVCLVISFAFGGCLVFPAFSTEDIYPRYNIVLYLIVLVLFLHSWMNFRRLLSGKSLKWMICSVIVLSVLSFGLSRINFIDYKGINRIILNKCVWYNYSIDLPESDRYDRLSNYRRRATVMFVHDKTEIADPILLLRHIGDTSISCNDFHKIELDSICQRMREYDENMYDENIYQPVVLYINKDIPMKYVNELKKKLSEVEVVRVQYAVVPTIREYDRLYYTYWGIARGIPLYYSDVEYLKNMKELMDSGTSFMIDLREHQGEMIMFNDSLIRRGDLKELIKEKIKRYPDYVVRYNINETSPYSYYVSALSSVLQAVYELRNDYSLQSYQKELDDLRNDEYEVVVKEIPTRFWEITEEMDRFLKRIDN